MDNGIYQVDWITVVNEETLKSAKISKEEFVEKHDCVIFYTEGESFLELHSKECITEDFIDKFLDSGPDFYDIQIIDENYLGIYVSFPYMETGSTQDIAINLAHDIIDFVKDYNR